MPRGRKNQTGIDWSNFASAQREYRERFGRPNRSDTDRHKSVARSDDPDRARRFDAQIMEDMYAAFLRGDAMNGTAKELGVSYAGVRYWFKKWEKD